MFEIDPKYRSGRGSLPARAILAVLLGALLFGVAACGSSSSGGERQYVDAKGREVSVPADPKSVVVLSEPTLDAALALGVKPVATTSGRGQATVASYLSEEAGEIENVGILGQPDLERIALLGPDLILIDGTSTQDDSLIDKLAGIAPTVYVSGTGEDWKEAFMSTAESLNMKSQGEEKLEQFDARVADIRDRLGNRRGDKVSIVRWGGIGLPAVIKSELAAGRVLDQVGLSRPAFQAQKGPGHSVPVSLERLDLLDGDWMFFGSLGNGGPGGGVSDLPANVAGAEQALRWAIADTPGFTELSAYKNDRIVPVDGSAWTSAGGYLAEQVVLDDIERAIADGQKP